MSRRKTYKNWIFRLAALMICLTVCSFCGVSNLYARYASGASGEASARVAKFEITESGTLVSDAFTIANMQPGDERKYEVQVTSDSEVEVNYQITARTLWGNLPLTFQMLDSSDKEISNQAIGTAERGQKKDFTLCVTWPKNKNAPDYAQQIDQLEITLTATQID